MTNDELRTRFEQFANARAAVLPSFAQAAAALGNTAHVAAQVEECYHYAETCGVSRQRADEIIREVQEGRAGSTPTTQDLSVARQMVAVLNAAEDFTHAMDKLVTQIGEAPESLKGIQDALLKMASDAPEDGDQRGTSARG